MNATQQPPPALVFDGQALKTARLHAGYSSAKKAAAALGVSPSAVYAWEKGLNGLTGENLAAVVRVYGVDLDSLFVRPETLAARHAN